MPTKSIAKTPPQKSVGGKQSSARKQSPAHGGAKKTPKPSASSKKSRRAKPVRVPGPRVRLGDAMRVRGLDEMGAARAMRSFIGAVSKEKPNRKLLLEALKEVFRVLEPVRAGDRPAADAPVHVQLIHYVARPRESQLPVEAPESSSAPLSKFTP